MIKVIGKETLVDVFELSDFKADNFVEGFHRNKDTTYGQFMDL